MKRIDVTIPGEPVPQPRHRHRLMKSKGGAQFVKLYTPKRKLGPRTKGGTVQAWKEAITAALLPLRPAEKWNGPVSLELVFYFSRTQDLLRASAPAGVIRQAVKPDIDNVEKAVMDAMTRCEIWADDSRVSDKASRKRYHAKGYGPGLRIIAELLDPQETLL